MKHKFSKILTLSKFPSFDQDNRDLRIVVYVDTWKQTICENIFQNYLQKLE